MAHKRILIFSATFGNGHLRAAEAIIEAIKMKDPQADITHLDFGQFLNKTFNTLIKNTYIELIKHTPKLWGQFYYKTSKIAPDSALQKFLNGLGRKEFVQYIRSFRPDLVICTYPTVAGTLAKLRENHALSVPLVTVVTDYAVHSQWIHKGVDLYIVGCQEVYKGLVEWGIEPERIHVTGIPVSTRFEYPINRAEIQAKLGLRSHLPTFLVMGGTYGVIGGAKWVCKLLADAPASVQVIVVCGRDEKLYRSLDSVMAEGKNTMIRFGFVSNVEELMGASDVIITKAGGLTVSEALTKRLPLVIFKPIPGQEEENAAFLEGIGAGITAKDEETLESVLIRLMDRPELLKKMSKAAGLAVPSRSAENAVELMLQLMEDFEEKEIG